MGNQHTHVHHPPSYYSVEYLNGSTGTSVPDILQHEHEYSPSGSIVERSFHHHANEEEDDDDEDPQVTLSTIAQSKVPNKMCTIQRSKSYVRPENKVLPFELPTKPLRKTNYLKTDGYKRTWRHKSGKNKQMMNDIANWSHASMPNDLDNIRNQSLLHRSESEESGEWRRPSSIAAIRDRRHIIQNEIKQFHDKYSRSMENLEEWTTEDGVSDNQTTKQTLYKKIFNSNQKTTSKPNVSFDIDKKTKGFKIDPVKVQPLTCSPNQKVVNGTKSSKSNVLNRPPNSTSTPTPCIDYHHNDNSFAISDVTKQSDKNSGILVKKTKSSRNKERNEVRKSVEFSFDNHEVEIPAIAEKKTSSNIKPDTATKAKAILLQSRRRQLMEQSINESLDLQEAEDLKKSQQLQAVTLKKGKLKSKSFLHNENGKSKTDSIKMKFGIRSTRNKKKEERVKAIDLERDIQIISRFPINSKVYRHYIAGGAASDKLTNSYNAAKMVKPDDINFLSSTFISQDSDGMNERAIDVTIDDSLSLKSKRENDKKSVIDSINQVFDPIYDSIDDYQSRNNNNNNNKNNIEQSRPIRAFVKPVIIRQTDTNTNFEPYQGLLKNTTSFKPIAKVNPTALDHPKFNQQQNFNYTNDNTDNNINSSVQARISKFNSTDSENLPIRYNNSNSNSNNNNNNNVNRKCSMSSDKLEPILEGTPNKNNNNAKRKNSLGEAAVNNQRLNEKLQNEIQKAYEERKKRFNQVKMAIRSNSILSNTSYQQIFQSSSSSPVNHDIMIRLANKAPTTTTTTTPTNRINERQLINNNNNNNISPLPSPPICASIPLQYSVSSCSSVTLPPPPPPPTQIQKLNYVESIMKDMRINKNNNNVNENEIINKNKHRLANNSKNSKKLHHHPKQQQQKQLHQTTQSTLLSTSNTTTTTTNSSSSSSSSSTSNSSSTSSSISYSEKYYSAINKNENLLTESKPISSSSTDHQRIQNIFDTCTNELLNMNMDINHNTKEIREQQQESNFILKSKPTLSSEYTCSNNSYQISYDGFERRSDNQKKDTNKSLPKHRRRGLDEVFPDLKDAIQDAQNHVQILNIIENKDNNSEVEEEEEEEEEKNEDVYNSKNFELKIAEKNVNKFRIDDPDWCPASDLGDFEFDDCELKAANTCKNTKNDLNEDRPNKKKTKQNDDLNEQPRLIAKPIPINIKSSTSKPCNNETSSPIFSKIQTKLTSFESMNNKSSYSYSTGTSISVNQINSNKWNTNEGSFLKVNSNINNKQNTVKQTEKTKCKFEITVYPCTNTNKTIQTNNSDDNEYDYLHYDDDDNYDVLDTTTTTVPPIIPPSINNKTDNKKYHKPSYDTYAYVLQQQQQQQQNYRRLIKMKEASVDISSDDDKNAEIKKQNWQTCVQRANSIQTDMKPPLRLPANKSKTPYETAFHQTGNPLQTSYPQHIKQQQQQQQQQQRNTFKNNNPKPDEALDAILYETDRKSSIGGGSDGKRNPIYYSSSSDISNLM